MLTLLVTLCASGCTRHAKRDGPWISIQYSSGYEEHIITYWLTISRSGHLCQETDDEALLGDSRKRQLSAAELNALRASIVENRFFALAERYGVDATDLRTIDLTVTDPDHGEKSVHTYGAYVLAYGFLCGVRGATFFEPVEEDEAREAELIRFLSVWEQINKLAPVPARIGF